MEEEQGPKEARTVVLVEVVVPEGSAAKVLVQMVELVDQVGPLRSRASVSFMPLVVVVLVELVQQVEVQSVALVPAAEAQMDNQVRSILAVVVVETLRLATTLALEDLEALVWSSFPGVHT